MTPPGENDCSIATSQKREQRCSLEEGLRMRARAPKEYSREDFVQGDDDGGRVAAPFKQNLVFLRFKPTAQKQAEASVLKHTACLKGDKKQLTLPK